MFNKSTHISDIFVQFYIATTMNPPKSVFANQPPNAWSTLPTFNSRRAESLIQLHRGLLDASRYEMSDTYRDVRDELRAAYVSTPPDVRVQQWLERQQQRREWFSLRYTT
uniref:Uncharacterized protein n=1 Tax=Panagrellus redivivus TaxID=6233 RepID=A0A7E4UY71_PANRE